MFMGTMTNAMFDARVIPDSELIDAIVRPHKVLGAKDDPDLGPVFTCIKCQDEWPADYDFWAKPTQGGKCLACEWEDRPKEMRTNAHYERWNSRRLQRKRQARLREIGREIGIPHRHNRIRTRKVPDQISLGLEVGND
jgi:hypothetical protein